MWTASRNNYLRDNSKFRTRSEIRKNGSLTGGNITRPKSKSNQGVRNSSKPPEGQKSELFKKVETLQNDMKSCWKVSL